MVVICPIFSVEILVVSMILALFFCEFKWVIFLRLITSASASIKSSMLNVCGYFI